MLGTSWYRKSVPSMLLPEVPFQGLIYCTQGHPQKCVKLNWATYDSGSLHGKDSFFHSI